MSGRPSAATARPPRYPFEAAAYADPSQSTSEAGGPNMPTARPPRYPFEPAARAAGLQPSAALINSADAQPSADRAAMGTAGAATTTTEARPRGAKRKGRDAKSRKARAAALPFEPAAQALAKHGTADPASASFHAAASGDTAEHAAPTRRPPLGLDAPHAFPAGALTQDTIRLHKPKPWNPLWLVGAVAVISCSAFWLYRTYDSAAATAPGNAAAAALVETPALTAPQEASAKQPVQPVPVVPQPNLPPGATEPTTTSADSRATGPRRAGAPREADLTTAAGRAKALVDSGAAMLREGRHGLAEGMYMKALQEVPEFPPALADLVRVHLARRDGKEAVRWAERLIAKQDSPQHQLLLGDAQALRGNSGAAQDAWTKAANGGNKSARQRLADTEEEDE